MKSAVIAVVVVLSWVSPSAAQTLKVSGTVVAETGVALPGTLVTLAGHGPQRLRIVGADGAYEFRDISPGMYRLSAELDGFRAFSRDLDVTADITLPPIALSVALRGEDVVVSASKNSTRLVDAPAAMSVLSADALATSPAQNYGDLLRSVPGVNVIQISARDVNVTSRQGTGVLANSELVLLDGRTIYLDFLGIVLWDFLPSNMDDVKQIEVLRGPASAVWGANAFNGVINIITKAPREAPGASVVLTAGRFSRSCRDFACDTTTPGSSLGGAFSLARAPSDRWAFRLSGGYFQSDALARRRGTVPTSTNPSDTRIRTGGAAYPAFSNEGTRQPKGDIRVDQELANGGRIVYGLGLAATQGLIHTGIGPFKIEPGSYMGYGKINYSKGAFKINGFTNRLDVDAPNLLLTDATTSQPLLLKFKTNTYDIEAGHSRTVRARHFLTYGGNARRNTFDISIARGSEDRNEVGAYLQDEVFFKRFHVAIAGRVDKFGNVDHLAFSPRIAATFKVTPAQALRVTYNRAFRAPDMISNYLDITTKVADLPLGAVDPSLAGLTFPVLTRSAGNAVLKEERISAYEAAYVGTFAGKTTASIAFYVNDLDNTINFTTDAAEISRQGFQPFYTGQNPPPGWPLPPRVIDLLAANGVHLPALFVYLNLGPTRNKGVEAWLDHAFSHDWDAFANYSYQTAPKVRGESYPAIELVLPPRHRFNAGLTVNSRRLLGSISVNYTDGTFWSDVLNEPYHGATKSFAMLNASIGLKWGTNGTVTTTLKGTNLTNRDVQQHIFADVVKRSVVGEVRILFR